LASLADFCQTLPVIGFAPGAVLLGEGTATGRLYVLVEGEVEIVKGDFQINVVSERGAIFGEMSALLGLPHTATVGARTACTAHETEGGVSARQ
jgi:CRP/FNR family transcriptional regulator, cyclic AMP receptor protein